MFTKSAAFYNAIYAATGKDYIREAQQVYALIQQHMRTPGKTLLDVACGTANHLAVLREWYEVAGLDLDARIWLSPAGAAPACVSTDQIWRHSVWAGVSTP